MNSPTRRRARRIGCLTALAALGGTVTVGSLPASGQTEQTTFVVLAENTGSVDAAIAGVEAGGGVVLAVNEAIGLITVAADANTFQDVMAGQDAVAGVARNTPIGYAPDEAVNRRDDVEREGRGELTATIAAVTSDDDDDNDGDGDDAAAPEPFAGLQWDMAMIGATVDGSYDEQPGDERVLVGIIDTGIDGSHPDIAANFDAELSRNFTVDIPLVDGPCEEEPDMSCNDPADVDEDGHGTHVAGTVAAPINGIGIAGVAPNVRLVNLRAGQDSGFFFLAPTVDALTFAADNGIDVVNMSFFVDPWLYNCIDNPADSPAEQLEQATIIIATQRALEYARSRGVTLVGALGNEHADLGAAVKIDSISPDFPPGTERTRTVTNDCIDLPAEGNGVISVSSVGPSGKKSDFSNHGLEQNDVAAPGGFFRDFIGTDRNRVPENLVLGPYPAAVALANGEVDPVTGVSLSPFVLADCIGATIDTCAYWQFIQGTSMAAPHAAGVAALIVSEEGRRDRRHGGLTLSPAKVERILRRTATDVRCPAPVITYAAEGRPADFDAPCVGNARRNSIYGDGIVNALAAVD